MRNHRSTVRMRREVVRKPHPTHEELVSNWFNSHGRMGSSRLQSDSDFGTVWPIWITSKAQKPTKNRPQKTDSATPTSARGGEEREVGGGRDLGARLR